MDVTSYQLRLKQIPVTRKSTRWKVVGKKVSKKSLFKIERMLRLLFLRRNRHKSVLRINKCTENINFRSNLIAKIDSAGRVLFVAAGKCSETQKIINFH